MEYGRRPTVGGDRGSSPSSPPPPPEPSHVTGAAPLELTNGKKSDEPLLLVNEFWDITSISALAALRMLMDSLERLTEATGDVPPTPPVSRPTTPRESFSGPSNPSPSAPIEPPSIHIGSPEAHPHEQVTVVGADAQAHYIQHAAIARRFFSKVAPPFSVTEYLLRLHKWCAHSPGVYLGAAAYIQRLCVADLSVPATSRTIHRIALAAIRVAAKALEDNKWPQDRMAKVGGVSKLQLMNLEVTLCFLLDFDLWVDDVLLARSMFLLQQAARQGQRVKGQLGEKFRLRPPKTRKQAVVVPA